MNLTRTVLASLVATSLFVVPAHAGWKMNLLKGVVTGAAVAGVAYLTWDALKPIGAKLDRVKDLSTRIDRMKSLGERVDPQLLYDLTQQMDNIQQIGWQAMLHGQTKQACDYFYPLIRFDEESLLSNVPLFQSYSLCCRTPEAKMTAFSAFIVENAPLLAGMNAPEAVETVVDLMAEQAGRGETVDNMKALARQSTQVLIEQCPIVAGAYTAIMETK